jgi:hypothetical protein
VAADVHCSQGGTRAVRQGARKPALSARASSEPPNLNEISEDTDFTVVTTERGQSKTNGKPNVSETAISIALSSSPTPESHVFGSSVQKTSQFLTAPRQKIPPVVNHHHFQGDMTWLNKDFHSKFQPIGFTTYRIKAGIACQTSTYHDYLDLQSFLKENKVPFNLIKHDSKPCRVLIKGIPPTTPSKAIQDELHAIELANVPQSEKIV